MIKLLTLYFSFVLMVLIISGYLVYVLRLPSPRSVITTIFLVIVSPLLVGYFLVFYVFPAPEVAVPDVTWRASAEAFSIIKDAGLKPRVSDWTFDASVPSGRVIEQQPKKGKMVKTGRIVNLTLSTGQRKVPVPNLIGRPFNQVETLLSDSGLRMGATMEVETEDYQSGIIMSQLPSPEVQVDAGYFVNIFISRNPKFGLVEMPSLVGKKLDEAKKILAEDKLNLSRIEYQDTDILAPNIVMREDPQWQQEVSVGTSVKLTISRAPTQEAQ